MIVSNFLDMLMLVVSSFIVGFLLGKMFSIIKYFKNKKKKND